MLKRVGAGLVDGAIELFGGLLGSYFGVMVAALVTAIQSEVPEEMQHSVSSGFGIGFAFWTIAISIVNRVLIQGVSRASIGKKIFGLELISSGAPITWNTMFTRWIFSVGSAAVGGLGYWFAFFQSEGRTFHDLMAHTDVVPQFSSRSMRVEYQEDSRTFQEVRQTLILNNMQAERPTAQVIQLPINKKAAEEKKAA